MFLSHYSSVVNIIMDIIWETIRYFNYPVVCYKTMHNFSEKKKKGNKQFSCLNNVFVETVRGNCNTNHH